MKLLKLYFEALCMMLKFEKNTLEYRWLEIFYGIIAWLHIIVILYAIYNILFKNGEI